MRAALAIEPGLETDLPPLTPANDAAGATTLLRFITCGSVDDGKSTLIGRMLYEAGAVFEDHLEALDRDSRKFGTTGEDLDFALLVDGLSAEREQGITIDVAYRYFATPRRAFIVADTPGHEQYTRNMATGASTADLAIILVDARKGLLAQTRRHSFIVSMLGVRHVVVAINKMDLVSYDEAVFRRIEAEYRAAVAALGFRSITFIPVSARAGDNITTLSARTPWYSGPALLPWLETIATGEEERALAPFALPVQWVNRPDLDFRGFAGTVATGAIAAGAAVRVLPSGRASTIARIVTAEGDLPRAAAGQSLTLTLADEVDVSRGDVLVSEAAPGAVAARSELLAQLIVTGGEGLAAGDRYLIKLGAALANATVVALHHAIDIDSFAPTAATSLGLNGIGLATLRLDKPLVQSAYALSRELGGFILVDRASNETIAFGFVEPFAAQPDADEAAASRGRLRVLRMQAERWMGAPGTVQRILFLRRVSWWLASALLTGAALLAVFGELRLALAGAAADLLLRPALHLTIARLWRKRLTKSELAEIQEAGGGI